MTARLPYNEKQLFQLIATGDTHAFEHFYQQYRERVYTLAIRWLKTSFDAEELTQEVFVGLWISRAGLTQVQEPKNYLFRTVYNQINKTLRKSGSQDRIREFVSYHQQDVSNITNEQLDARELNRLIEIAVENLPKQKKLVYRMSRQEGKTNAEIAEILRISPLTVKDHLKEAIQLLRKSLNKIGIVLLILK